MPLRILWMDVEVPGSYGWGSNGADNREVFNGFWDYVTQAHEGVMPGVYSTNYQWGVIMSGHTGLPHTWEWTAQISVASSPAPCPTTFSDSRQFADFFGGQRAGEPAHRDMAVVAGQRRLRPDRHEQGAAADHALTAPPAAPGAAGPAAGPRTASARKGSPAGAWPAARSRPRGDRGP